MRFGDVALSDAAGAILAHSMRVSDGRIKKGTVLGADEIARLAASGFDTVVVASLGSGDLDEDTAAARIARALLPDAAEQHLSVSAPFTGRANLYAETAGLLEVDTAAVMALNGIDDDITLATLGGSSMVSARQMVATVKIIPYGVAAGSVDAVERLLASPPVLRVRPVTAASCDLILTRTDGMKDSVLDKGAEAVRSRVRALGIPALREHVVPHREAEVAEAIAASHGDITLILTGSATSDRGDVGPAALQAAGGELTRFGMPVDPGNLLFLGRRAGRPVIGLPGCARSPRLNGADWVLERVACGVPVTSDDIAAMGVGGLLKEIASRPEPRGGGARAPRRPKVAIVLLAAGASSRMRGRDKLLEDVDGAPLVRRIAERLRDSGAERLCCVVRPDDTERVDALAGLPVDIVHNPRAADGLGTSLAAGIASLGSDIDAAVIALADMPGVSGADIDRLIAGFDPQENRAIIRATTPEGRAGHPVLFGRRFFEALRGLSKDQGAREVIAEHPDFVTDVQIPGTGAVVDLDTPEDWAAWRAARAAAS
ncbi:MAG: molybdopterin-binding/glycosyltransferase family 2 protein [Pseudomonadota bacterium]